MEWLQLVLSLIGILGLIIFLFYLMKKINRQGGTTSGKNLRIIDKIAVGRDSSLAVICVSEKLMLVGITQNGISMLSDLDMSEEEYLVSKKPVGNFQSIKFSDVLSNAMGISKRRKQTDNSEGEEVKLEENDFTDDKTE